MKKLFNDKELANEFGKEAQKNAKNDYDEEEYYKKTINLYNKAIK